MKNVFAYLVLFFLLVGCKKEVGPQSVNPIETSSGNLIVINEGNFGFGNASVSLLNPENGEIANNQYKKVNGIGIGDVLQSVKRYKDRFYFVVNNSGKVVVTDTNLKLITEITGLNSPRYIDFYGNTGFVTDLIGFVLMIPQARMLFAGLLLRRWAAKANMQANAQGRAQSHSQFYSSNFSSSAFNKPWDQQASEKTGGRIIEGEAETLDDNKKT